MKEFKHKISFATKISPLKSEDKDKFISLASKNKNLNKLLPKDVNLTENVGFQLFCGESCVSNTLNANSDGVKTEEAIKIAKEFPLCYINVGHNRSKLCGVIIASTFTDYKTGKELTETEVREMTEPFAITITGIVWRAPNPDLADAIASIQDSGSSLKDSVYISWELGFSDVELVIMDAGNSKFSDGKFITNQSEINELLPKLISNGGNGFTEDGKKIGRVPVGDVTALGIGLVENPAAAVSPIEVPNNKESIASYLLPEPLVEKLKSLPESGMGYHICDIQMNDGAVYSSISIHNCSVLSKELNINEIKDVSLSNIKGELLTTLVEATDKDKEALAKNNEIIQNNISQAENNNVITIKDNTNIHMKIEKIEQLTDENLKEVKASELKELFASSNKTILDTEIKKISDDYVAKLTEKDKAIQAANDTAKNLEKSVAEVKETLTKITENHDKLVAANIQREAVEAFSARMETIENGFDLDDKQKEIVANKVKSLSSDEQFTAYLAEIDILLAAKKKAPKNDKAKKEDAKDGGKDDAKEDKDGNFKNQSKASLEETIKNGEQDKKNALPNAGSKEETLADKSKRVFGTEGWTVVDKRKNRLS